MEKIELITKAQETAKKLGRKSLTREEFVRHLPECPIEVLELKTAIESLQG